MGYKKALIITFSGIGDAVLTEVLCENLRKMNKDIEIDLVVKNNAAPLFIKNKAVTNVISYENDERKNLFFEMFSYASLVYFLQSQLERLLHFLL